MAAPVQFKDHFSTQAGAYATARPGYPPALFDAIAKLCAAHEAVWDAGCGNGQAAIAWAARFAQVFASDPSAAQIANAAAHERVRYAVEPAERCSLGDASVDLVGVAQALHWFDFARFFADVQRVLRPGGVFAAWSYGLLRIDPAIDPLLDDFEHRVVGPYWPPERRHVDAGYTSIEFPFARIPMPAFAMALDWSLEQVLAYLGTWSAVQRCIAQTGEDPIAKLSAPLHTAWGDPQQPRRVEWPLVVWVGRASGPPHDRRTRV
jgi:SAM-dependent methyltransferase